MGKDKTILQLIEKLKLIFNFNLLEIVDYWESDLCAIGLKKGNKIIYISTYNYVVNEILTYDFDLEIIDENDKEEFEVISIGRNVSEIQLISEIKLFFDF